MNPLLALALIAVAGIAATRLPRPSLRPRASLDLAIAAGAPFLLFGVLLGPGLGVLDHATLRALAPITALGIGWIGATLGARLEWRVLRSIPLSHWAMAVLRAAVVISLIVLVAGVLTRAVPALAPLWRPRIPALLTLAAAALVATPGLVARSRLARGLDHIALLDTVLGVLVFTIAIGLYHPRQSFGGGAGLGLAHWVAVAVAASGGVGVLFLLLSRLHTDETALRFDLVGVILLGAGIGYATNASPLVVGAAAMALIVNISPQRQQLEALLTRAEAPIYALILIVIGASLDVPTLWLVPAVLLLGAIRLAARWVAVQWEGDTHAGLATIAQGSVALALALSFTLIYGNSGGSVLTTVLLGVALAQAIAPRLLALALRRASPEVSA